MKLSDILAPCDEEGFFERHWEKAPLHMAGGEAGRFRELLTLDAMSGILSGLPFRADECKVAHGGKIVPRSAYVSEPGMRVMGNDVADRVNTAAMLGLFEQGATLVFAQLDQRHPPLRQLKEELERRLAATVVTNVFLSNRSSQGFSLHYDSHDVFVLQVHGHKIWSLHDSPVELPTKSEAFGSTAAKAGPLVREIDLKAGEVLYVPRGFFHEARSTDDVSLHVTLGIHPYLWGEYLVDLLRHLNSREVELRRSVPSGVEGREPEGAARALAAVLRRLVDSDGFVEAAATVYSRGIVGKLDQGGLPVADHLGEILRLSDLTAGSRLRLRSPSPAFRVASTDDGIAVSCLGQTMRFPRDHGAILEVALSGSEFTPGNIDGNLPLEAKLAFARKLVCLGLLVRASVPMDPDHRHAVPLRTAWGLAS